METVYIATMLDLYKRLLVVMKEKHCMFICKIIEINRAKLTTIQKVKLKNHFLTQFPSESQYTEFYNNPLFNKYSLKIGAEWFNYERCKGFAYCIETESYQVRIKLIEAIIENLEKNPELNLLA